MKNESAPTTEQPCAKSSPNNVASPNLPSAGNLHGQNARATPEKKPKRVYYGSPPLMELPELPKPKPKPKDPNRVKQTWYGGHPPLPKPPGPPPLILYGMS